MAAGEKYDSSINNEITLTYSRLSNIILSYELKGKGIGEAIAYFDENSLKYNLDIKPRDFFSEEELKDSEPDTLIKTDPELGSSITVTPDTIITVYYYDESEAQTETE